MRYADSCATYVEQFMPVHGYRYSIPCVCCSEVTKVFIRAPELYSYRQGTKIQTALRSLSPESCELLMSGICPTCWDKTFGEDEQHVEECYDGGPDE